MRRDPLLAAVASTAVVTVVTVAAFVATVTWTRHEAAMETKVDCAPMLRMIDDAFSDGRMSRAEAAGIDAATDAMRATANRRNAVQIGKCVGLPRDHPLKD
jgi:hypothetical protein